MPSGKRILLCALSLGMCLALLLPGLASCRRREPEKTEKTELVLATTGQYRTVMEEMVRRFNEQSDSITVKLRVYGSEQEKNYFLTHGSTEADVYTFQYALDANRNRQYLHALSRSSLVNRYLVSAVNNLRAQDDELYVLPADGGYYTMCYNTEMLAVRGYTIPETLTELLTLADRLGLQVYAGKSSSAASVGGDDSVLIALMSLAYPMYLNTVYGTDFLENFLLGKTSICEERNRIEWTEIFENLKILYDRKFFTLDDLDKDTAHGVSQFKEGQVTVIQNSPSVVIDRDFAGMKTECAPFVGKEKRDACFGSMPTMYIGVSASTSGNAEKLAAAHSFLNYFATPECQAVIHELYEGGGEYISYLKSAETALPSAYTAIQKKANEGRLFLADMFKYAFGICVAEIADYLRGNLSTEELLNIIDAQIREGQNSETASITEIARNYEFDSEKVYTGESEIGRFFAFALNSGTYLDGALIPSSYIRGPLLKGSLTEKELDFIFPEKNLIFAELNAKDYLKIHQYIAENDSYPLSAGLYVSGGAVFRSGGNQVKETERLYVLIPAELAELLGSDAKIGKATTTKSELLAFFAKTSSTGVEILPGVNR